MIKGFIIWQTNFKRRGAFMFEILTQVASFCLVTRNNFLNTVWQRYCCDLGKGAKPVRRIALKSMTNVWMSRIGLCLLFSLTCEL